jgi:opacity protein-like surface antigen
MTSHLRKTGTDAWMIFWKIVSCFVYLPVLALAQSSPTPIVPNPVRPASPAPIRHHDPVPAARGLRVKASIGYAYTSLAVPSSNRVNLSGVDATLTANLSQRLGAIADSSYVRASDVFNSGRHADVLSYLAGPVFYPTRNERLRTFVHGLVGGARVNGVSPTSGSNFLTGYVNKLSWAFGGGIEYPVSRSIALRVGGDYQHTYFFNSGAAIRGQNNFRAVCSVVYSLWQHPERRR